MGRDRPKKNQTIEKFFISGFSILKYKPKKKTYKYPRLLAKQKPQKKQKDGTLASMPPLGMLFTMASKSRRAMIACPGPEGCPTTVSSGFSESRGSGELLKLFCGVFVCWCCLFCWFAGCFSNRLTFGSG